MGWTEDLLGGLAELLDTAAAGTWRPDGTAYTAAEVAIVPGPLPSSPDRVIALACWPIDQDGVGDIAVALQVRTRGTRDPRTVDDVADAVRDALDGLAAVRVGGVWVSQIYHRSGAVLGKDGQDRHERSDNYVVQASRPTALRTD